LRNAVIAMTYSVARDYLGPKIRCNCIAPGSVHTPMLEWAANLFRKEAPKQAIVDWGKLHPLGRVGEVREIVEAVLYLESAAFVTGETLHVDGGAHAGHW
jgi:NAD(P)-dependent dehydrogenase (short-subunit alcohol dehydrogenase family)